MDTRLTTIEPVSGHRDDAAGLGSSCASPPPPKSATSKNHSSGEVLSVSFSGAEQKRSTKSAQLPGESSRIPFYAIGLILATTAVLKLWMLLTDPFADIRVGIPKEIVWLSVGFEFWLAYQNFHIRDRQALAFVNALVFGSFAISASVRWLLGYASCGCSGNVELPLWIFILLDAAIVAWFVGGRAGRIQITTGLRTLIGFWRGWSLELRGRLVGFALFGSMILAIQLPFAAPLRAIVLGEPPVGAIVRIDGDLLLGQDTIGHAEIWNRSSRSAKIVGMSRSCRCFELGGQPIYKTIPANEQISLPLLIKPEKTGPLHQRVVIFLDHPKQFRVNVDVLGTVKGVK